MKKEFLVELGVDEAIISKIMAENGKDIEREKAKFADRDELKTQADELKKQLEEIQALKPEELQAKVGELTQQLETQATESAKKLAQIETQGKVKDYLTGKNFVHKLVGESISKKMIDLFLTDESKGKSLDDLYKDVTKDLTDFEVDPNKPQPPKQGDLGGGGVTKEDDDAVRAVMGLPPKK